MISVPNYDVPGTEGAAELPPPEVWVYENVPQDKYAGYAGIALKRCHGVAKTGCSAIEFNRSNSFFGEREFTMPVVISDETLSEAGLSAGEALVEIACRLFDVGKLRLWSGARLAQLSRVAFEQGLRARHIALYRPTVDDLDSDLNTLDQLGV